jgi:HAD superfamily hydrolase (TIGR01509 family)
MGTAHRNKGGNHVPGERLMPASSNYTAVIFDLDGTLIDTESLCNQTGIDTCAALGLDVSLGFFESLAGVHDAERIRRLSDLTGQTIDPGQFNALWDEKTYARFKDGIPIKPGVFDLLHQIRAMGLPMAIATSSRRLPALTKLEVTGLRQWMGAVVTCDDIAQPKPAPDAYLHAADLLGVIAARCLVFEDSEVGTRSAWDAGMTVVQVPDQHPASGKHAHFVANSVLEGARAAKLI